MNDDLFSQILQAEDELNNRLFVLIIPSKNADGKDLADHELWVDAAGELMTRLFGGPTIMPPATGMWLNPDTGKIIPEKIVQIHCYAKNLDASQSDKIRELGQFLHRMGRETQQGEVVLIIDAKMLRIRRFDLV